jgi:hypothetical protein
VLRVLRLTAQGMVWPWLPQSMCRGDAIEHALRAELIWAPVGDHLGYHTTDAGQAPDRGLVPGEQVRQGDATDAERWWAADGRRHNGRALGRDARPGDLHPVTASGRGAREDIAAG